MSRPWKPPKKGKGTGIATLTRREKYHLDQLEELVPPEALIAFCMRQSDERFHELGRMIYSHPAPSIRLARMAHLCRLNYYDITDAWLKDKRTEGMITQAEYLPKILEDIAQDSMNKEQPCAKCQGSGFEGGRVEGECGLYSPRYSANGETCRRCGKGRNAHPRISSEQPVCSVCGGSGVLVTKGDKDARDQMLKAQQIITSKPMVQVNTQVNAGIPDYTQTVRQASKAMIEGVRDEDSDSAARPADAAGEAGS